MASSLCAYYGALTAVLLLLPVCWAQCHVAFNKPWLSTFHLEAIVPSDWLFTMDDQEDGDTYKFQFCSNLKRPTACTDTDADGSPAWQFTASGFCIRLGNLNNPSWEPITANALGLRLTYSGGSKCGAFSRSVAINFLCDDGPMTVSNFTEPQICQYEVTVRTPAACPSECMGDKGPCSGSGVCRFDTDAQRARCFCFTGQAGDNCETTTAAQVEASAPTDPVVVLGVVVVCLLCAIVTLGVLLYRKMRALRGDDVSYGALNDSQFSVADAARPSNNNGSSGSGRDPHIEAIIRAEEEEEARGL